MRTASQAGDSAADRPSPPASPAAAAASHGPSCGPAAPRPCHRGARDPRRRDQPGQAARPSGPTRFRITASWCRPGSASGRPATARTCCSNWPSRQASIVQWPELCGRGAISLASSRPSGSRNISSATTPDQVRAPRPAAAHGARAASATAAGTGPARRRGRGCGARGGSRPRRRPRRAIGAARGDGRDLAPRRARRPPAPAASGASRAKAAARSAGVAQHRLAAAVIAESGGLQHGRQAERGDGRGEVGLGLRRRARARPGRRPLEEGFSATRSWQIAGPRRPGGRAPAAARASSVAAGTFSNSKVTTSTAAAKAASAAAVLIGGDGARRRPPACRGCRPRAR